MRELIIKFADFPPSWDPRSFSYWVYAQLEQAGFRLRPLVNPFDLYCTEEEVLLAIGQPYDITHGRDGFVIRQGDLNG